MNFILLYLKDLLFLMLDALTLSLQHNWKVLLFAISIAVILKTYVDTNRLSEILLKRKKVSIIASVLFGTFTPLCACGTTAVIIGMLTTTMPWGPIMAFLTSSPLMSPDGFILISGVIGLDFAIALTVASIMIGLASGFITMAIEKKTSFLDNQSRFSEKESLSKCNCGNDNERKEIFIKKLKLKELLHNFIFLGLKQILLFYSIFICIGSLINHFVPASIISLLFGAESFFAVPLASLIGLPLYITTDSAIPVIQSMIQSGASQGAMLAFMITGSATSVWVIAGLTTFMKKRAITLYVAYVLIGGIVSGYLLDLISLFI